MYVSQIVRNTKIVQFLSSVFSVFTSTGMCVHTLFDQLAVSVKIKNWGACDCACASGWAEAYACDCPNPEFIPLLLYVLFPVPAPVTAHEPAVELKKPAPASADVPVVEMKPAPATADMPVVELKPVTACVSTCVSDWAETESCDCTWSRKYHDQCTKWQSNYS